MKRPSVCYLFHDETTEGCFNVAPRYRIARKDACPISRYALGLFHDVKGRRLFTASVRGLLSELQRKNVEAIAPKQGIAPSTLQRFLESIAWGHDEILRRCRKVVVSKQSDRRAIGIIDERGTAKAGRETVGIKRQYNGNRGKVENAVVSLALSFATALRCGTTHGETEPLHADREVPV